MKENSMVVKHISKQFKSEMVLDDINLELNGGNIYGFVGRNGSGKTVLFKILCGYMRADKGEVIINGDIIGKDLDFPKSLGVIIENPGFLPYYSGYKNLKYLAGIKNLITSKEIEEAMSLVGLDYKSKKWVGRYSLGMKQRLGIAQAIMEHPNILILDEPMNALDSSGVGEIRSILKKLKESGKLIILASHNKEDIELLCNEVYIMQEGKLVSGD